MSFIKNLGHDLTSSLIQGDSFLYAHLVKFENVATTVSGQILEQASDYSYVTDASFDVKYDDGSKQLSGVANGEQTYSAARVSKVSNITETTEAKVSNVTLQISSIALNTEFIGSSTNRITVSNSSSTACKIRIIDTGNGSWTDLGFSEGDKIQVTEAAQNVGKTAVIERFEDDNTTAIFKHPSAVFVTETNATDYIISLATDQVTAILNDPSVASYNGYINREVSIFKAHISADTGNIIGVPYLLFKGIISKAKLTDDPTKNSTVTWTLTSHWGDFIRINGRMTSDSEHRSLGTNGLPDLGALFRDDYASDFGFAHAEQAINIMAVYQVMETRYKMKKSGFIFKKYKMVEYQVEVDREVDLRINLEAKRLPLIYGVQRTDSIPIFADSLHNDPAKIYVAYAICEGEVSGLYDIYVDDQSRICVDKNDSDIRDVPNSEGTIEVVCEGRMDQGDTLSSSPSVSAAFSRGMGRNPTSFSYYGGGMYNMGNWLDNIYFAPNITGSALLANGATGITHEKQTTLDFPIKAKLVFHAGRSHQRADDQLTRIAQNGAEVTANGFKLQATSEEPKTYWGSNHRLLDTAYVVAEFDIAEGDVTIPTLDFVVRGKEIEQYNYDLSYKQDPSPVFTGSNTIVTRRALFKIGDYVDFYHVTPSGSRVYTTLSANVQIMDATIYKDARNEEIHKFRFSANPLGTLALQKTIKSFFMVAHGASPGSTSAPTEARYPLVTWDHKSHSGIVPLSLTQEVTEVSGDGKATVVNTSVSGGTGVDIKQLLADIQAALASFGSSASVGFVLDGQSILDGIATFLQRQSESAAEVGGRVEKNLGGTQVGKENIKTVCLLDVIKLAATASSVDDYYKGQTITVVNTNATTGAQKRQSRIIIKYIGSTRHALVGSLVDVASTASQVPGTFISTVRGAGLTSITFSDASSIGNELTQGQIISAANSQTAVIPQGTKILSRSNNTISVDKPCNIGIGASILAHTAGGSDLKKEHPEPFDFVPQAQDTYEIASEGDKKVSINPAIQLLDYLTNGRYGRGLEIYTNDGQKEKDINLETFRQAARICDTRANVSVILPSAGTYTLGNKWRLVSTVSSVDYLQWEGTILSVVNAGAGYKQVTFTDCIGKLAHKWFDWKSYDIGNIIYHQIKVDASNNALDESAYRNKVYRVDVAGKISPQPFAGNMSQLKLQLSTNPSTEAIIHGVSSSGEIEANSGERENPIVKAYNGGSYSQSGYSMYDSDDVKYWRYLGWQEHDQREVTRHQTNALIRTDSPLFDNVNSMLKHFNGILRYSNGLYELDVETTTPTISASPSLALTTSVGYEGSVGGSNTQSYTDPRIITQDDIIGAINVDDAGLKGSANSVSVTIADPNIRYDNLSVNFFKSEYLKEDRNIPKKKDVKTPLITNYYNARINAEQYLDQSRFSRKINFVIGPKGVLLLAGTIIKLYYERFGWVGKEFRISNLSYRPDCSVQVTAEEHSDDTYLVTAKEKTFQGTPPVTPPGNNLVSPASPNSLTAVGSKNLVTLNWVNSINFGNAVEGATWRTEVWYNNHASFTNTTANTVFSEGAVRLNSLITDSGTWDHIIPGIEVDTTFYYWVRHVKRLAKPLTQLFSAYHPTNVSNGVSATAVATPVTKVADMFLYKLGNSSPAHPSGNSNFPTITVSLAGSTYGTITGVVASGSASLTNGQIIDTAGTATGWYISEQNVSASNIYHYRVTKRVSVETNTTTIPKGDWGLVRLQNVFSVPGDDVGHNANAENQTHTLYQTSEGAITNPFESGFSVIHTDGDPFSYAASGTTNKTYKITLSAFDGVAFTQASHIEINSSSGDLTLHSTAPILQNTDAGRAILLGSFIATLSDNGNEDRVLGKFQFKIYKSLMVTRSFISKTYNSVDDGITEAQATAWKALANVSGSIANAIASIVIADTKIVRDGLAVERRITPGDRITLKHTSGATPPVILVATRIYTGPSTSNANSADTPTYWSPPVVEEFDGSVIVNGTLSADKITGGTITGGTVNVKNNLVIDAGGKFFTPAKTSMADTGNGFFLDTSGDLYIGSAANHLKYTASNGNLDLKGNFSLAGPSTKVISIWKLSANGGTSGSLPTTTGRVVFSTGVISFGAGYNVTNSNNWYNTVQEPTAALPFLHQRQVTITQPTTGTTVDVATGDWGTGGAISIRGAGITGTSTDFIFKNSATTPNPAVPVSNGLAVPTNPSGWHTDVASATGTGFLWFSKGVSVAGGAYTWTAARRLDADAVAEIRIYSNPTTGSAPNVPAYGTQAVYNFTTNSLTGTQFNSSGNWNTSPPSVSTANQKVWSSTALITGSSTSTHNYIYAAQGSYTANYWTVPTVFAIAIEGPTSTTPGPSGAAFYTISDSGWGSGTAKNSNLITAALVLAAIQRYAVKGDLVIVNNPNWVYAVNSQASAGFKCTASATAANSNVGTWQDATSFLSGDLIVDGSIGATQILAGSITSDRLTVGTAGGGQAARLKLYPDALKIFDGSSARVKLGNLSNITDE